MPISLKTRVMVWGRAASRCSFPECNKKLIVDATRTDDGSLIGDVCHIVAEALTGPRGNSTLTAEERNDYDNLILLCKIHHKVVDDQEERYTTEVLHEFKNRHEERFEDRLDVNSANQHDDELYAAWVDEWASRIGLADWTEWTSHLLAEEEPWMTIDRDAGLFDARAWLLSRVWPHRYPEVEDAFRNFLLVLDGMQEVFRCHAEPVGPADDILRVGRFYKIPFRDEHLYHRLLSRYKYYLEMIADLTLELTRAANYMCDRVREFILPSFRLKEGALFVEPGLFLSQSGRTRPEYRDGERISMPYPGFRPFEKIRGTRDVHFRWPDRRTP